MAAQNKDSKNNVNDVVKPVCTSEYDENRGSYMDANGNYVYTIWERRGKKWAEVPVYTILLGENGENAEWIIMLDHDDHEVDLQNRYQNKNADYEFINRVADTKAGDDEDMSDTDAWAMIEDPKADVFDTLFPEEEIKSPKLQQLEEFMKLLTPDQINLIYEHYGAGKNLKQICDEENAANGTDKSPQSVGNQKKKILERLKKLFEKAEK